MREALVHTSCVNNLQISHNASTYMSWMNRYVPRTAHTIWRSSPAKGFVVKVRNTVRAGMVNGGDGLSRCCCWMEFRCVVPRRPGLQLRRSFVRPLFAAARGSTMECNGQSA